MSTTHVEVQESHCTVQDVACGIKNIIFQILQIHRHGQSRMREAAVAAGQSVKTNTWTIS